jgi:hypothetical protein
MAIDFIKIDLTKAGSTQAQQLKNFVDAAANIYSLGNLLRNKMTHMHDGTDFVQIETNYGLPAGQGQVVFDLINGAIGSMSGEFQTPDFKTITEKLG